uniref:Uncharacterized protein n=1 Tax=Aegilops tauschii subsp. strangulata TaxID=200361 RepID=A0A453RAG2_AEGTS
MKKEMRFGWCAVTIVKLYQFLEVFYCFLYQCVHMGNVIRRIDFI